MRQEDTIPKPEGQNLDKGKVPPSITIEDLKLDRTKLTQFGQARVPGINNDEELDTILRRNLVHVNRLFEDKELSAQVIDEAEIEIDRLNSAEELNEKQVAVRDVLPVVRDFAVQARNGDKTTSLLVLQRLSRENNQANIAYSKGQLGVSFSSDDVSPFSAARDVVVAMVEISNIKYASEHDGRAYQTAEEKKSLEAALERGKNTNVT